MKRHAPSAVSVLEREIEPISSIASADLGAFVDRVRGARVVLLGEATHGTAEFYEMRARITQELVRTAGFTVVALEADWPDAARINDFVLGTPGPRPAWKAFARFPAWMWRNEQMRAFAEWLRAHNAAERRTERRVEVYGLDLYSLYTSIGTVLDYLDRIDPAMASLARGRYACLSPWEGEPETYGREAWAKRAPSCQEEVTATLRDLLDRRLEYVHRDGQDLFDAVQNARLVANAERYYRTMYLGSVESWNLRDEHMFGTLQGILSHKGPGSKAVVWEHNSHVGDARATLFARQKELNVGQLCRERFGEGAHLVGFGTDHGTVMAARFWDAPGEVMEVRPSHPDSHERLFHESGLPDFLLSLRGAGAREILEEERLERAIGVVYRPETEIHSHYFDAVLARQFDEYIWFDRTRAVTPLATVEVEGPPETYPFGL